MKGDWTDSDSAFARAAELAPDEADVLNNQGWSQLMRGNWKDAETLFEKAVESMGYDALFEKSFSRHVDLSIIPEAERAQYIADRNERRIAKRWGRSSRPTIMRPKIIIELSGGRTCAKRSPSRRPSKGPGSSPRSSGAAPGRPG